MIPKIIHMCWLSGDPFPEKIQKCIDSWKNIMPDWDIIIWDTKRFDIHKNTWTNQAFESKKYAFVADYIRFYALYNYGGVYLDSDIEVLKSFNNLIQNKCFFGFEYSGAPEAAVVASEKNNNWIKIALEWYENKEFINKDGTYNITTCPIILKYAFEKAYNISLIDNGVIQKIEDISIFPYEYFSPKNGFTDKIICTQNTYCIHHFNSSWLKLGFFKRKKRLIHIFLIKILGKNKYNLLMHKIWTKKISSLGDN